MADFHFDALLTLHSPVCLPPFGAKDPYLFYYNSSVGVGESQVDVCIIQRVPRDDDTDIEAGGVSAQVVGRARMNGDAVCVDASSVQRSGLRPGDATEDSALVVFSGIVVSTDLVPGVPSITLVDVQVFGRNCEGDSATSTLRCRFDRSTHHLQRIGFLGLQRVLFISGNLVGSVDGHTLVDVHDVKFNEDERPCVALPALRVSPALRRLGAKSCQWISSVLRDMKRPGNGDVSMVSAEASEPDESAWLVDASGTAPGRAESHGGLPPSSPVYSPTSPQRSLSGEA